MIVAIVTAFGLFPILFGSPLHIVPERQATQFGTAIVAHGYGDGAWFPLMDEITVVYDTQRPITMCATSRKVVDKHEFGYEMRERAYDQKLELVSCVPEGVMFVTFEECGKK